MIAIKNNFIEKVTATTTNAMGAHSILLNGIYHHDGQVKKYPDSKCLIGVGHPPNPTRVIKYAPTHKQVQDYLLANKEIVMELFLTQILQEWFDFLLKIYEKALGDNLKNKGSYRIPPTKLNLDLALPSEILSDQIISSAIKGFDFFTAKEKLIRIERTLHRDLSAMAAEKQLLAVNIKVRNILQHSSGVISNLDLIELGASTIDEDHGDHVISKVAQQKVTRTAYDIERLTDNLMNIANALIP